MSGCSFSVLLESSPALCFPYMLSLIRALSMFRMAPEVIQHSDGYNEKVSLLCTICSSEIGPWLAVTGPCHLHFDLLGETHCWMV
jgi:hypothetical protein